MLKIVHVREIQSITGLSAQVKKVIWEAVAILDDEYGADRNVDHGDGGYVLVIESKAELAQLQDRRIDLEQQYLSMSTRFTKMTVRAM